MKLRSPPPHPQNKIQTKRRTSWVLSDHEIHKLCRRPPPASPKAHSPGRGQCRPAALLALAHNCCCNLSVIQKLIRYMLHTHPARSLCGSEAFVSCYSTEGHVPQQGAACTQPRDFLDNISFSHLALRPSGGYCQFSNTGDSPSVLACGSPPQKFLVSTLGGQCAPPPPGRSSTLFNEQLLGAVEFLFDDSEASAQRQGLAVTRDQGRVGRTQQPLDLGPEARVQAQHQGQLKGGH